MYIIKKTGPFKANQWINFSPPSNNYTYNYVQLGIQAPQSPLPSQQRKNLQDGNVFYGYNYTNRFAILLDENWNGITEGSTPNKKNRFIINANEILEFEDLSSATCFQIIPFQDMDAYTIIEIQFSDNPDS